MKTTPTSAGAGVVPNHIRRINIATGKYGETIRGDFPADKINYTDNSIGHILSDHEYTLLNNQAEKILKTIEGDIKIVIDITGREYGGQMIGTFYAYRCIYENGRLVGLEPQESYTIEKKVISRNQVNKTVEQLRNGGYI